MTVDIIDHSRIIMHTEEQTSLGFPNIVFRKRVTLKFTGNIILSKLSVRRCSKWPTISNAI